MEMHRNALHKKALEIRYNAKRRSNAKKRSYVKSKGVVTQKEVGPSKGFRDTRILAKNLKG